MRLKRTGKTNHRVTQGKIYHVDPVDLRILDDNGIKMQPSVLRYKDRDVSVDYWQILENKEEKKMQMLKIETGVVLIDGVNAASKSTDLIIELIEQEKAKVDRLREIGVSSKAIDAIKERHTNNIVELVKIIDAREVEDETAK
jgi:hypothetical protein